MSYSQKDRPPNLTIVITGAWRKPSKNNVNYPDLWLQVRFIKLKCQILMSEPLFSDQLSANS